MICLALAGAGEQPGPGPRSPAAVAAVKKCERGLGIDEAAARTAKTDALRQLVTDLKSAQAEATKAGALPEANAIQVKVDEAQRQLRIARVAGRHAIAGIVWDYRRNRGRLAYLPDGTIRDATRGVRRREMARN